MSKRIHLMGICGTGVGSLAGLLKRQGHHVRGSDENVYPPMSDKLAEWGIEVLEGYDAAHLQPHPDLVIVGNVIRRENPEATYAREHELPTLSMPQAVAEFGIGSRHAVVVCGTHGKTTTTALAAHVLVEAGRDPSFLVGGALVGYADSFRAGAGDVFVVEGDEYDTAYFDKGPKFVHYRPRTAVITSLEFDHADIFASIDDVEAAFVQLIQAVPADGNLVVWHGAERARRLIDAHGRGQTVITYASEPSAGANLVMRRHETTAEGLRFEADLDGQPLGEMTVPMWGEHSAQNVLAVIGELRVTGLGDEDLTRGLKSFAGVRRRMEVLGEPGGVTVVDDFAHHPTAVRSTLAAARARWPRRRLWAVFEPRSATNRRNVHHAEYVDAFSGADEVIIGTHARLAEVDAAERFDPDGLAADLRHGGTHARYVAEVDRIVDVLRDQAATGDVVMVLSNGDFGGLHRRLLAALEP